MDFKIKIENFEGPIDALLFMIEKRKMTINDISLATIADDYIQFIKNLEHDSLSNITHFVFVAATLTLIKSKSLLPHLELTQDEEGDIENLKKHLALFNVYQHIASDIKNTLKLKPVFYYPRVPRKKQVFTPDPRLTLDVLSQALLGVFHEIPVKTPVQKTATLRIAIHIEDMMESLEQRIKKIMDTDFDTFITEKLNGNTEPKAIRVYKVVGFLAMLELVKNGVLQILQRENFDQIRIESLPEHTQK